MTEKQAEINKKELYALVWAQFGAYKQIVVAMEECAELTKELSKVLRDKGNLMNVAEEIADVEIMIEQIKQHFACGDTVEQIKDFKLRRLHNKLNEGNNNE